MIRKGTRSLVSPSPDSVAAKHKQPPSVPSSPTSALLPSHRLPPTFTSCHSTTTQNPSLQVLDLWSRISAESCCARDLTRLGECESCFALRPRWFSGVRWAPARRDTACFRASLSLSQALDRMQSFISCCFTVLRMLFSQRAPFPVVCSARYLPLPETNPS